MTATRFHRIRAVLERRQPDLTVVLENVHKPHNLAAILRTADAVGIFEAHAVAPDGAVRTSVESAGGTDKWIDVKVHRTTEAALDAVRASDHQLLAAHPEDAEDYRDVDFTRPTALILGQEKDGLTKAAAEAADRRISVPMAGFVTSLNVSVAAAVILFEAQRQRATAGLYESSRLPRELFETKLFEWTYPKLADLCRRRGEAYPRLDQDGELLDPVPR